jgi:hypothetical protein
MSSRILSITVICLILFGFSTLNAESDTDSKRKGCFELGIHYGFWSINLLKSSIEGALSDALETELKEPILDEIQADYPEIVEKSYSQEINFDSSGHNFGFEVRWYPKGKNGSFSLGLSLEKTSMLLSIPDIRVTLESTQGHVFQGEGTGYFDINPVSVHLSFCWDIKPIWRIHPYIVFGFGIAWGNAFNDAEVSYSVSGTLVQLGQVLDTYEQSDMMTVAELKQDLEDEGEDFFIPDFFPFFQLNAGVKGEVTRNVFLFLDVGFWDGFMIRGGFAFRFL